MAVLSRGDLFETCSDLGMTSIWTDFRSRLVTIAYTLTAILESETLHLRSKVPTHLICVCPSRISSLVRRKSPGEDHRHRQNAVASRSSPATAPEWHSKPERRKEPSVLPTQVSFL